MHCQQEATYDFYACVVRWEELSKEKKDLANS